MIPSSEKILFYIVVTLSTIVSLYFWKEVYTSIKGYAELLTIGVRLIPPWALIIGGFYGVYASFMASWGAF